MFQAEGIIADAKASGRSVLSCLRNCEGSDVTGVEGGEGREVIRSSRVL